MKAPELKVEEHGAASYWLQSDRTELYVTELGGHAAPVRFKLKHRWVSPYALAPWAPGDLEGSAPVWRVLRGSFFALPFETEPERGQPYGESANAVWQRTGGTVRSLVLACELLGGGRIEKELQLRPEHRALYQEHRISGVQGRSSVGIMSWLQFPEKSEGNLAASAFEQGQVRPRSLGEPAHGVYGTLQPGAQFRNLRRVPLMTGGFADLSEFPARGGFDDMVMLTHPAESLAWVACRMDGYIWIALRRSEVLPSTVLWFSHGGRHDAPWNGRHRARVGVGEVRSYFDYPVRQSRRNPLAPDGPESIVRLSRKETATFRSIHAVHQVPSDFGGVDTIEAATHGRAVIVTDEAGLSVEVPVDLSFLEGQGRP